jgi:hypothetical protein
MATSVIVVLNNNENQEVQVGRTVFCFLLEQVLVTHTSGKTNQVTKCLRRQHRMKSWGRLVCSGPRIHNYYFPF